jgi:hypothetical protein
VSRLSHKIPVAPPPNAHAVVHVAALVHPPAVQRRRKEHEQHTREGRSRTCTPTDTKDMHGCGECAPGEATVTQRPHKHPRVARSFPHLPLRHRHRRVRQRVSRCSGQDAAVETRGAPTSGNPAPERRCRDARQRTHAANNRFHAEQWWSAPHHRRLLPACCCVTARVHFISRW